jgi:hypothetical protein
LICIALCACGTVPAKRAPAPAVELENIDVYGSAVLDRDHLLARHGDELVALLRASEGEEKQKKDALVAKIRGDGDFAYVDISKITYFGPKRSFITVDLVDARDRAKRMTFLPEPTGSEHADPDGLIALWDEYQEKFFQLLEAGKIDNQAKCPFWHCLGFGSPELDKYRERFATSVPAHEAELVEIFTTDKRGPWRGNAAFLLAHLASGPRVVELMLQRVRDSDTLVRNNTMRVLALVAINHTDVEIPLAPVVESLRFPSTLDRNKAVAVLSGLVKRPALRAAIRAEAGAILVELLALKQPNNHDFAYAILKELAGKDLGEHDIAAWEKWLATPQS